MNDSAIDFQNIERLWLSHNDLGLEVALAEVGERVRADLPGSLAFARMLARMERIGYALTCAEAAASEFPEAVEPHVLRLELHLRVGDADAAWAAFCAARERGLPLQDGAVGKALEAATVSQRFAEAKEIFGLEEPVGHSRAWRAFLLAAEVHDGFAARWRSESLGAAPRIDRIHAALAANEVGYAAYLVHAASVADELELPAWELLPYAATRSAGGLRLSALTQWRRLREYPNAPEAKIGVAYVLISATEMRWARRLLDEILALPVEAISAVTAEMTIRALLSCAMFGSASEQDLLYISARFLNILRAKDQVLLTAAFAARSSTAKATAIRKGRPANSRPRVAVCLSGQLRSFRSTWPMTANALARMDATVFVSTWDSVGAGLGVHDTVGRKLSHRLRQSLPIGLQTRTVFAERYPESYKLLNQSDKITNEECANFFGTPHVDVVNECSFNENREELAKLARVGSLNQAKMYFGIHNVIKMKKNFETKNNIIFDIVVRLRPDMSIYYLDSSEMELCMSKNLALTTYTPPGGVGDQILMMKSGVADIIGGIWDKILDARSFAAIPGGSGFGQEFLLGEQLAWHGVSGARFRATRVSGLQSTEVSSADLWDALRRDLSVLDTLTDADLAIARAVSKDAGQELIGDIDTLRRRVAN